MMYLQKVEIFILILGLSLTGCTGGTVEADGSDANSTTDAWDGDSDGSNVLDSDVVADGDAIDGGGSGNDGGDLPNSEEIADGGEIDAGSGGDSADSDVVADGDAMDGGGSGNDGGDLPNSEEISDGGEIDAGSGGDNGDSDVVADGDAIDGDGSGSGTLLIRYGFEDYTGDVETTPGYIFTASSLSYWNTHLQSTEVISSCNGLLAHSGNYYLHQNFYTEAVDPCLGTRPTNVNDHGNIGGNFAYPDKGFGDDTEFRTQITTDTLVVRFYLRTQGDWEAVNPGGKCKFTRTYGVGGAGDAASLITHYTIEDNRLQIYDPSTLSYGTGVVLPTNLHDGNWHAFALMIVLNNHDNSNGNITASVWWEDYEMRGAPILTRTVTCPEWGDAFFYFDFWQNWSATYPSGSMGIDVDDIEVWDGMPDSAL